MNTLFTMKLTFFISQGSNLNIFRKKFGNNSNKKNVSQTCNFRIKSGMCTCAIGLDLIDNMDVCTYILKPSLNDK